MQAKTPAQSAVESRYIVMPHEANASGSAFGGVIMAWVDVIASMAAQRHCRLEVVTAGIDSMSFREPIYIGEHVVLKAMVNYVGCTSMEVGVRVIRENPYTGEQRIATTAHLTFVALDANKKPTKIEVGLLTQTDDEKKRYENAKLRVQARKELLARMKKL